MNAQVQASDSTGGEGSSPALVVLVHGAWHGAWCWATFQGELDRRGVPSLAVDLPGHGASTAHPGGLHDDARHVALVLDRLRDRGHGPVVLVGHSYGGAVITEAASGRSDVDHLVYVAAFALDDGESVMGALGSFERHDVALGKALVSSDDGTTTTVDPAQAQAALYGSSPPGAIGATIARLDPQPTATMTEAVVGSPRDSVGSTYVVCRHDEAVHPEHQRIMAARCTHRVELDSDHSPFLSDVDRLADVVQPLAVAARARSES